MDDTKSARLEQSLRNQLIRHKQDITEHGDDMPGIRDWQWPY